MLGDKNYVLTKMHICSFERKNGILTFDMEKYPERLCVLDKNNKVVIDVETYHQYPYIRVMNMQYFLDIDEIKKLDINKRVGCMEYATFSFYDLDKETLKRYMHIVKLLKDGEIFPDGNKVFTNDQYLNMINCNKNCEKMKKIGRKRK